MLFLIHGDNLPKTRSTIIKLQEKLQATNKKELDITEITPDKLKEVTRTFSIFDESPFIVIDISKAGRSNLEKHLEVVQSAPLKTVLVFFSDKELGRGNAVMKFATRQKGKVLLNSTSPTSNIFKFIDNLFSRNRKATYNELRNLLLDDEDPFHIFSMILYGLRNVSYVKYEAPSANKMAPFVKRKSQTQANKFTEKELETIYSDLYAIDKKLKSGGISSDIVIPYVIEKIL